MTSKWLDLDPQTAEIHYDSQTKDLIECLPEDPEDNPAVFIPIIELHIACLEKAHLLCAATSAIIQNKWEGGTDLADIGKFLQAWAPEPYRDKPMLRGSIQALLGTAPNTQGWSPADLSDCTFRDVEATDTEEDLVRKLNNLGTSGDSTIQEPTEKTLFAEPTLIRIFPPMRSLHDIWRDWLSDEELWLAIPESEIQRQCLNHAPRHSWKLMVEFFLALNTNVGSWIQNLERRDMMLLGSMAENTFGFAGTYARQKQASLAPILTVWKRWVELPSTIDTKTRETAGF